MNGEKNLLTIGTVLSFFFTVLLHSNSKLNKLNFVKIFKYVKDKYSMLAEIHL